VTIRYAALDDCSTRMAIRLCELGCEPGARVAMVAHRKASLVAAILGTFKAGCIHVPLDPRMPQGRLQYILSDITPAIVITEDDLHDAVVKSLGASANTHILTVSEIERLLAADEQQGAPAWLAAPRLAAPAHCVYTPRSTG